MKIKRDFITNSSSSSYVFIFNGDKIDLYKLLFKYKDILEERINDSAWVDNNFDMWDLIRELDKVIRDDKASETKSWLFPSIENIEEKLHNLKEYESNERDIFMDAIAKGFTSVLMLNFGDNEGEISGTDLSSAVDHARINIDESDFIIISESNH